MAGAVFLDGATHTCSRTPLLLAQTWGQVQGSDSEVWALGWALMGRMSYAFGRELLTRTVFSQLQFRVHTVLDYR